MSKQPDDWYEPYEKKPHTHKDLRPRYEPWEIGEPDPPPRNPYERLVDKIGDDAKENMYDATCLSPDHRDRSVLSRIWSLAKGLAGGVATIGAIGAGSLFGIYSEPVKMPYKPTDIVKQLPEPPANRKIRLASGTVDLEPVDPSDPGASTTIGDESGSPADLKGTPLDEMGRYIYWETTKNWIGYGTRFNTVVKIVLDTQEMTAKITFERGDFKADDDGSAKYKSEKAFFARQPAIVECTCKVNRKFYLHDRRGSDSYIDVSEYDTYMTYSWPKWRNIDADKYHFLLNFTDFQWTGEPFITSAMFDDTNPEPYRISRIGILEKDKGKLPVMRMFTVDGRSDYYISFVVSTDGDTGVPGIISFNDIFHQFVEKKEYTGGAPGAASGPTMPAATPTPTPTPTPILIESGKPQVTANGGGTVTAGDDGSVSITPDTGKKIGQILVNDDPLPVPPDGRLTGFTPEDKVEVRFIGQDEPMPTLPPAQTVDNGSGGAYTGDGGSGGAYTGDGDSGGSGNSGSDNGNGSSGDGDGNGGGTGDNDNSGNGNSGDGNTGGNGNGGSSGSDGGNTGGSGTQPTTPTPAPKPNPNISLTRAQLLNLLWSYKGYPIANYTSNPFSDVSESDYYYQAVLWALEAELIEGTPGSTLEPNRVCTFDELAPIMQRYYRMF